MNDLNLVAAVNRIADALFQQAKAGRAQVKVSEQMLDAQKANLAVTKALEEQLTAKTSADSAITRLAGWEDDGGA